MALSTELINAFVKATNDKTESKHEATVYGTAFITDGVRYVKLDGSNELTPVSSLVTIADGDRVKVTIKDHRATVTGNVSSISASADSVIEVSAKADTLNANKVDTTDLNAVVARVQILETDSATVKSLEAAEARIDSLDANVVTINKSLTAQAATIKSLNTEKLDADTARITYATIDNLEATDAKVHNLEGTYGEFHSLIFGSATGNTIQTSFSNSVIAQLGDAQIKSAMIDSVSASKITAGDIITNNVRVMSDDGKLLISDETIQISDDARVRVQIGKDAANDYSINIWDADGNLMFSEGGITDDAIKEAIIRNDMVSDSANIAAHKLDIDSLFEEINGSTNTIKSTRVYLDDKSQTLDVAFKSLSTDVNSLGGKITSQGTQITAIQGQITSKIWQQDIDTATDEMSTQYSTLEQELGGFKTTVGKTYATQTALSTVEQTANGLTTRLDNMRIGGRNLIVRSTETVGRYIGTDGSDVAAVACSLSVYIPITPSTSYVFTKTTGTKDNYFRYAWYTADKTYIGRAANSNNEILWTSPSTAHYVRISYPSECKVKFEKGSMATDWSPAPEDIDSDILAATKTATNYLNFSSSGLVVGDHTASTLGKNVLIDSEAVRIRTGSTVNAVFGADIIELAKDNESATISMLNGAFKIYYDADNSDGGFGVYGVTSDGKERLAFQPVNENDNLTIGWGGYDAAANLTNIYGNGINLFAKAGISFRPGEGQYIEFDGNAYLPNGRNIFASNKAGNKRSIAIWNASDQLLYGYGSYVNSEGSVYYDGNTVNIRSKKDVLINGRAYGKNQILWSGARYMSADHTNTLSAAISAQPHGIVLVFSQYVDGAAANQSFVESFIPKTVIENHNGKGHCVNMTTSSMSIFATKYLYISDTQITGHDNNVAYGTADCGIKYANSNFVLRYVIGV